MSQPAETRKREQEREREREREEERRGERRGLQWLATYLPACRENPQIIPLENPHHSQEELENPGKRCEK